MIEKNKIKSDIDFKLRLFGYIGIFIQFYDLMSKLLIRNWKFEARFQVK